MAGGLESLQEKLEARASSLKAQMMNLTQVSNGSVVGIYERDDSQDARLDALEIHVQVKPPPGILSFVFLNCRPNI